MESTIYILRKESLNSTGDKIILYYYCKRETTEMTKGRVGCSVGIDMYTQRHGERTVKEENVIKNAFDNIDEAKKCVDKLCGNVVLPSNLKEYVGGAAKNKCAV